MKRITITYHMGKPGETAENCITVPMSGEMAELLMHGYDQGLREKKIRQITSCVDALCQCLAEMAGYVGGEYVGCELAARQYEEVDA